jgi:hypothetical protein
MVELKLDRESLRSLVQEIVTAILAEQQSQNPVLNGRLAFKEKEAAALLGLNPWQLRDLRLAGKVHFSRIVGNQIRYTPDDLRRYLAEHAHGGNS